MSYEHQKRWRARHPDKYKAQMAAAMKRRRTAISRDYIIGRLRAMGFSEFPDTLILAETTRIAALRHAGKYKKDKLPAILAAIKRLPNPFTITDLSEWRAAQNITANDLSSSIQYLARVGIIIKSGKQGRTNIYEHH